MKMPLVILAVLFACTAQAQLEEPSLFPPSRMQTHQVRGISATQYLLTVGTDGKTHADTVIGKETYLLDAEGRITQRKILPGYRSMAKRIETRYDSLGRKVHLVDETQDAEGKRVARIILIWSYLDGMKPYTQYEYLAADSGKSVPQGRIVFDYDEAGRTATAHHLVGLKEEKVREVIAYPAEGKELHRWVQDQDTLAGHTLLTADALGHLVHKSEVRPDSPEESRLVQVETVWKYDELGFLREKEIQSGIGDSDVRLMRKVRLFTYQYDAEGLLIEEIQWHFPAGASDYVPFTVTRFEYEQK